MRFFVFGKLIFIGSTLLGMLFGCGGPHRVELNPAEREWLEKQRGDLRVLWGYHGPPLASFLADGSYGGLLVEYSDLIQEKLGVEIESLFLEDWQSMLDYAYEDPNAIIVGIAETDLREERLRFTSTLVRFPYILVTNTLSDATSLDKFESMSLVSVADYAVNEFIRAEYPDLEIVFSRGNLEGLQMVSSGEIDGMVINQVYLGGLIEEHALSNLRVVGEIGYINRLKVSSHRDEFILHSILQKAVDGITPSERQEIYRTWVGPQYTFTDRLLPVLKILGIILAVCLLGLGVVSYWSFWLRKIVRRQTAAIREGEERYQYLWETSNDGLFLSDTEGRIIKANRMFKSMVGLEEEESLSEVALESLLVDDEEKTQFRKNWRSLLEGSLTVFEIVFAEGGDSSIVCELSGTMHETEPRKMIQVFVRNVSKQREFENALREAKESAEASSRAKDEFLAVVSHELRTPLNPILGFATILKGEVESEEHKEYLQIIGDSATQLAYHIDQVCHYSQLQKQLNLKDLEYFRFDFFLRTLELQGRERSLLLLRNGSPPRLREYPQNLEVKSSLTLLRDILRHLLSNSVKFSPAETPITITGGVLGMSGTVAHLRLEVADQGQGISLGMQKLIFEAFTQEDYSSSRHFPGMGLGLAICRRLVDLLHGSIGVESVPGEGATFWIELEVPYRMGDEEEE